MFIQIVIDSKFRDYSQKINSDINFEITTNQNNTLNGQIFAFSELQNVKRIVIAGFIKAPLFSTPLMTNTVGLSIGNFTSSGFVNPSVDKVHFYFKTDSISKNIINFTPHVSSAHDGSEITLNGQTRIDAFVIKFYEFTTRLTLPEDFFECVVDYTDVETTKTLVHIIPGSANVGGHGLNGHGIEDGDTTAYASLINFRSDSGLYQNSANRGDLVYRERRYQLEYVDGNSLYIKGIKLPNNNSSRNVIIFIENRRVIIPIICETCEVEDDIPNYRNTPKANIFN
jgi:hypothetical protein